MLRQNDNLFISHFHSPESGYTYLEENDWLSDGQLSASSVIHNSKGYQKKGPAITQRVSHSHFLFQEENTIN
jgi:hypothetical protein